MIFFSFIIKRHKFPVTFIKPSILMIKHPDYLIGKIFISNLSSENRGLRSCFLPKVQSSLTGIFGT